MSNLLSGLQKAKLEAYNLPYDLTISTATITCKINVMFHVYNIAYYFNDFDDIIIGKKFGNRVVSNIVNVKRVKSGKKQKKKEKKNFFNQVSLIFRSATLMGIDPETLSQKEKFKNINVKLFINGSIQMTGCKHLDNIKKCLEILFEKLKVTKVVYSSDMKRFEKKKFVGSIENLDLSKAKIIIKNTKNEENGNIDINVDSEIVGEVKLKTNPDLIPDENFDMNVLNVKNVNKFEIRMINTNFNIGFFVNRNKLHQMLIEQGYDAIFDPITHACVNITYNIPQLNKNVSVFVFESGSITIAGSNSCYQISLTYDFINKFILSNYSVLLSKPITPQILIQLIQNMKN